MAYEKTDWQEGDLITEERLDKMEQGIADGQNAPVTPAGLSGYDAGTGHGKLVQVKADGSGFDFVGAPAPADGSVTNAMLAGGITADKLAKGVLPAAYTLPAATTAALGGVKRAAAVATVASADAASAAADAPTKAEYDKLVAVANETKMQLNALLAAGKAAGFLS